ncbi:MAG: hypothetical protein E6Q83_04055 [Thiothrix sp.]|nr:MAG: hypothetical protein E6Q83_04055 [Thiothrix sp.]
MMKKLYALLIAAYLPCAALAAPVPQFKDYPVEHIYKGQAHALVLDEFAKTYKTRLRAALEEKVNFAGHYVVTIWGCGTSCLFGGIVDKISGKAYPLPELLLGVFPLKPEYQDQDDRELIYKPTSRLLIMAGAFDSDKPGQDDLVKFYEFKGNRFVLVKQLPYGRKDQSGQ